MALTALKVKNAKPGKHAKPGQAKNAKAKNKKIVLSDGGGLRLDVDKNGNKSWVFRYTSPTEVYEEGKHKGEPQERYMGLGPLRDVTLADARDARDEARKLLREGKDPIEHRDELRKAARVEASRSVTFKVYAEGIHLRPRGRMEERQAPSAVAQHASRLRLSAYWPFGGRRRRHRWRVESAAPDLERQKGNGSAHPGQD